MSSTIKSKAFGILVSLVAALMAQYSGAATDANNDSYTTAADTPLSVAAPGVLANDTGNDSLSVTFVRGGEVGIESTNPTTGTKYTLFIDGSLEYDPNGKFDFLAAGESANDVETGGFVNEFTLRYGATASGDEDRTRVLIKVTGVNDAPRDIALSNTVLDENAGEFTIGVLTTTDVDTSDKDHEYVLVDGDGSTDNALFKIVGDTLLAIGDLDADARSSYSIRVETDDQNGGVFARQFTISVNNLNDTAPVAVTDDVNVDELQTIVFDVITNDTDVDGDSVIVTSVQGDAGLVAVPVNVCSGACTVGAVVIGTLQIDSNGAATFVTNTDTAIEDYLVSVTYKVSDGVFESNQGAVNITINPVNDNAPTVTSSGTDLETNGVTFDEDGAGSAIDLSVLFSDLDSSVLPGLDSFTYSFTSSCSPVPCTTLSVVQVAIEGSSLRLSSTANDHGEALIKVTATDGADQVTDLTFKTIVNSINDSPVYIGSYADLDRIEDQGDILITLDSQFTDADLTDSDSSDDALVYTITIMDSSDEFVLTDIINEEAVNESVLSNTRSDEDKSRVLVIQTSSPTFALPLNNDVYGTAVITVRATDLGRPGETPNPLFAESSFTVTITANDNDQPIAEDDHYSSIPALVMAEDDEQLIFDVTNNDYAGDVPLKVISVGAAIVDATGSVQQWRTTSRLADPNDTGDFSVAINGEVSCAACIDGESPNGRVSGDGLLDFAVVYKPALNFNGEDSFVYCVQDRSPQGDEESCATVTVNVLPANDIPTVENLIVMTMDQADTLQISAENGLRNFVRDIDNTHIDGRGCDPLLPTCTPGVDDPKADRLYFYFTGSETDHGMLFSPITDDGAFNYRPDATYSGGDEFAFQVCDLPVPGDLVHCAPGIVSIQIQPLLGAPEGSSDEAVQFDYRLANTPLELPIGPEPNVLIINDDSGSMKWDIMVEGESSLYQLDVGNSLEYVNAASAGTSKKIAPSESVSPGRGLWRLRNSTFNTVYYNPAVRYLPWRGLDTDDVEFPNSLPIAARHNPLAATPTTNLTQNITFKGSSIAKVQVCKDDKKKCAEVFPDGSGGFKKKSPSGKSIKTSKSGKSLKSTKSGKMKKSTKSGKSIKTSNSGKSVKTTSSGKNYKFSKSGKAKRTSNSGKSIKATTSGKTYKFSKSGKARKTTASGKSIKTQSGKSIEQKTASGKIIKDQSGKSIKQKTASGKSIKKGKSEKAPGKCEVYAQICDFEDRFTEVESGGFYIPRYYVWTDKDGDGQLSILPSPATDPDNAEGKLVEIRDDGTAFPRGEDRTDCAGESTCSYAEEIGNFANWFTYYRTRELTAKAALGVVVADAENIRIGYAVLNGSGVGNQVASEQRPIQSMNTSSRTGPKAALLDAIYSTNSAGQTPLRRALRDAGRYFECRSGDIFGSTTNSDPGDAACPVAAAPEGNCQQNFTMMITDGSWNGGSPATGDSDADDPASNFDGGAFFGSSVHTLADVAMLYYERDLHPSLLANEVPTSGRDQAMADEDAFENNGNNAMHQHMKTYTVGFGVQGLISEAPSDYKVAFDWGSPLSTTAGKFDDLRHAAFNGRGEYLDAADGSELSKKLVEAFGEFSQGSGAASAVSFNSQEIMEDTLIFRAFYNTKINTGDLVAQKLNLDGSIGATEWRSAEILDTVTATEREILTWDPAAAKGIPFRPGSNCEPNGCLNDSQQESFVNQARISATATDEEKAIAAALQVTRKINYLRGDSSRERPVGNFRERPDTEGRLGDIVHSTPVFVGTPNRVKRDARPFPQASPYSDFRAAAAERDKVIYVASNDGMLHGFRGASKTDGGGSEVFGYVPNSLILGTFGRKVSNLLNFEYSHKFFVDLTPAVNDVYMDANGDNSKEWISMLMGGQGAGAKAYFALNVTDPNKLTEAQAEDVVLWEFTDADDTYPTDSGGLPLVSSDGSQRQDLQDIPRPIKDLGFSFNVPTLAMSNIVDSDGEQKWISIFGNGFNSTSGIAKLFVLFVDGGIDGTWCHPDMRHNISLNGTLPAGCVGKQDFVKIDTTFGVKDGLPNGLGAPRVIDVDGNGTADFAYAGDTFGNLFRFDLRSNNFSNWSYTKIFQAQYTDSGGNVRDQPITTQPILTKHPTQDNGFIVIFATGSYITVPDGADKQIQSIYGLWDRLSPELIDIDELVQQRYANKFDSSFGNVRVLTANQVDFTAAGGKKGWYNHLDSVATGLFQNIADPEFPGERAIRNIQIRGGLAFVNSVVPRSNTSCADIAGGFALSFCPSTGGTNCLGSDGIFDLNNDGNFDGGDQVGGATVAGIRFEDAVPTDSSFIEDRRITQLSDKSLDSISTNTNTGRNTGRLSWKQLEKID